MWRNRRKRRKSRKWSPEAVKGRRRLGKAGGTALSAADEAAAAGLQDDDDEGGRGQVCRMRMRRVRLPPAAKRKRQLSVFQMMSPYYWI